ncbi:hypothetical protein EYF80_010229 [Liparis tanakae]|uniref:Uncharacterized protein n=1 Tax=Liparis tanakae TaxID=230148 RepID=A0A4Z2IPC3_9TELE|nr:hypothetical protein EYF80_010229 [Liparis tanakae]
MKDKRREVNKPRPGFNKRAKCAARAPTHSHAETPIAQVCQHCCRAEFPNPWTWQPYAVAARLPSRQTPSDTTAEARVCLELFGNPESRRTDRVCSAETLSDTGVTHLSSTPVLHRLHLVSLSLSAEPDGFLGLRKGEEVEKLKEGRLGIVTGEKDKVPRIVDKAEISWPGGTIRAQYLLIKKSRLGHWRQARETAGFCIIRSSMTGAVLSFTVRSTRMQCVRAIRQGKVERGGVVANMMDVEKVLRGCKSGKEKAGGGQEDASKKVTRGAGEQQAGDSKRKGRLKSSQKTERVDFVSPSGCRQVYK